MGHLADHSEPLFDHDLLPLEVGCKPASWREQSTKKEAQSQPLNLFWIIESKTYSGYSGLYADFISFYSLNFVEVVRIEF